MAEVIRTLGISEQTFYRWKNRFVVLVNDQMGEPQAVDVLCHEWAHSPFPKNSHDRDATMT
ncbi:MAG: hypothetical protein RLZZ21_1440 [Planctomycetota bacterium]